MYDRVVIGIDQSYKNCGVSIAVDGALKKIKAVKLEGLANNTAKRQRLSEVIRSALKAITPKAKSVTVVIERIRQFSKGFISIDYIKSMGALNACIVDVCTEFGVPVYSVDTRCWKAQVTGSSKPMQNRLGIPPEKYPTILWLKRQGYEGCIMHEVSKRKKGVFERNGVLYEYDNDAADSACIALYGFVGDFDKLKEEH